MTIFDEGFAHYDKQLTAWEASPRKNGKSQPPPDEFERGGLTYLLAFVNDNADEPFYVTQPSDPFEVDGIRYNYPCSPGVDTVNLMIELIEDAPDSGYGWMKCSRPPTEAELDRYVRTGSLWPEKECP